MTGVLNVRSAIWASDGHAALTVDDVVGICRALGLDPLMPLDELASDLLIARRYRALRIERSFVFDYGCEMDEVRYDCLDGTAGFDASATPLYNWLSRSVEPYDKAGEQ